MISKTQDYIENLEAALYDVLYGANESMLKEFTNLSEERIREILAFRAEVIERYDAKWNSKLSL